MDTTAATSLAELVLTIVFSIVGLLAAWAAQKGRKYFEAKTGIDIPAKQEEQINDWVSQGIAFAEEKAHKAVKEKTEGITGPEKLEAAADFVLAFAQARGWDVYTRELVKDKIEAMLGSDR